MKAVIGFKGADYVQHAKEWAKYVIEGDGYYRTPIGCRLSRPGERPCGARAEVLADWDVNGELRGALTREKISEQVEIQDVEAAFAAGKIILWRSCYDNVLGITLNAETEEVRVYVDSRRHGIPEFRDWMRDGKVIAIVSQTPETAWYTTNT